MYFPYLRGRQFELIALREYAQQRDNNDNIIPIIEPVKRTFNSLKIAIQMFKDADLSFALILNPQSGELIRNNTIFNDLAEDLQGSRWIPAFIVTNNIQEIEHIVDEKNLSNVMLICSKYVDSSSKTFFDFITSSGIEYIISEENKTLKRKLRGQDKKLILLNDCFIPKKRNSDYLIAPEEKFTEEHLFYEEEGYYGFADYTALSSEFTEGGSTPFAVAIHLTFQKENDEIWIRHFTSISNDDRTNIQGKFAEAAEKLIVFLDQMGIKNFATNELRDYYNNGKYPGLGTVKKISIKNHLELVNSIL